MASPTGSQSGGRAAACAAALLLLPRLPSSAPACEDRLEDHAILVGRVVLQLEDHQASALWPPQMEELEALRLLGVGEWPRSGAACRRPPPPPSRAPPPTAGRQVPQPASTRRARRRRRRSARRTTVARVGDRLLDGAQRAEAALDTTRTHGTLNISWKDTDAVRISISRPSAPRGGGLNEHSAVVGPRPSNATYGTGASSPLWTPSST